MEISLHKHRFAAAELTFPLDSFCSAGLPTVLELQTA